MYTNQTMTLYSEEVGGYKELSRGSDRTTDNR